ncbi:ATP-dependent nuclease [Pseudomonas sp. NPDC089401]|uniref:ATP-dependent nuclease n=1 Tax=Pseudomonas sp. NPDC089401 TaxID=3364462 RepID=UPI003821C9C2
MARIRKVEIANFRGIKQLSWCPSPGINCLIGPGDSGKSTILDAIDLCLGARRSAQFSDTDFHCLDITSPISITLTLGELEASMMSLDGYGLFLRGYFSELDLLEDEPEHGAEVVLTLNLSVASDLEPSWTLLSDRAAQQGVTKSLAWKDRLALAPTRIGTYSDYNLSWQRGSVLNRISEERADASVVLVQAARDARQTFGDQAEQQLGAALGLVKMTADELGVSVGAKARALLDAHSVSFGAGTIALHNEAGIPLRGLGIGSTRLLIAGLQRKAQAGASIVLSDELEYGLEPHRITRFLGSLGAKEAEKPPIQAFLTTHSPVALRELSGDQLCVVRPTLAGHVVRDVGRADDIQSTIRLYPEAFLARSVIICEGASEIGLIRGLDLYRVSQGVPSLMALGVGLIDSGGGDADRPYQRAAVFQALGYRVMVVRDDDKPPTAATEQAFLQKGGQFIAWNDGRALEDELFHSLSVNGCLNLIKFAHSLHEDLVRSHVVTVSNNTASLDSIWAEAQGGSLSADTRTLLGKASRIRKSGWFKSISWMEEAARTVIAPDLMNGNQAFTAKMDRIFGWAAQ